MTLQEKKRALMADLTGIKDAQERLTWLIERGKQQPPLEPSYKTDDYRVEGCLSRLWFVPETRDGKCFFKVDGDSVIVKSIAGVLCDFYSGALPEEILRMDPSFLGEVGITQHLTPNRRNSLSRIWEKIREYAERQA